jgi:thymidine kinase
VLVSGLCATSELTVFGAVMPTLMALADEVIWCMADCDWCGSLGVATRSACTVEKKGEVLVGGESVYKAACPTCWARARNAKT